jgi:hypothetical protein
LTRSLLPKDTIKSNESLLGIGTGEIDNKRPLQASRLNEQESFDLLNTRKLSELVCDSNQNFYFLVKWKGKSYQECTWESEFFLKDQFDMVLAFAARKAADKLTLKKGKVYSPMTFLEDVLTARRFFDRGLELKIAEAAISSLMLLFREELSNKKHMSVQAAPGYEFSILIFLIQMKRANPNLGPILIIYDNEDQEKWSRLLELYYPQTNVLKLQSTPGQDQSIWKIFFKDDQKTLQKFDLLLLDLEAMRCLFHRLTAVELSYIVLDVVGPSDLTFKVLDLLNKPYYRKMAVRIACIPPLTVQSVGKAVINQTISLQVALRRFAEDPSLQNALLAQGLFPSASEGTLEFYLSTTSSQALLASVASSDLAALERRLDRPLQAASPAVVGRVVLRSVILRLSDRCKAQYASLLAEQAGQLLQLEASAKPSARGTALLQQIANRLLAVDDDLNANIVDDDAKTLEIDAKLRWIIKYFEALKSTGQTGRLLLVFVSEKAHLRAYPVIQRFTKYCCWQINDNVDAAEVNFRIAEFSRVEHKTTILTVNYKNLWKLSAVNSSLVVLMGHTGHPYQVDLTVHFAHCLESARDPRQVWCLRAKSAQVGL